MMNGYTGQQDQDQSQEWDRWTDRKRMSVLCPLSLLPKTKQHFKEWGVDRAEDSRAIGLVLPPDSQT